MSSTLCCKALSENKRHSLSDCAAFPNRGLLRCDCLSLYLALSDLEGELLGLEVRIDLHVVAMQHFAIEDLQRQRILYQLLDGPLERTRAVVHVVTLGKDQLLRRRSNVQCDLAVGQQSAKVFQPQVHDLR